MKRHLWTMAVVAAMSAPVSARAEEQGGTKVKVIQEKDRTVYRKKTAIDFGDMAVEGELTKPEGSYVVNRRKTGFDTRVKLRADFSPELQKSADHL
jgi:hypothetical protein